MSLSQSLLAELNLEATNTRKLLAATPSDKLDFQPHEKSMKLWQLAGHIAEMYGWMADTINTEEINMEMQDYQPFHAENTEALLAKFDENLGKIQAALEGKDDAFMQQTWTMRSGEQIFIQRSRYEVFRTDLFNHLYHHRGQFSVYLRLVGAYVPGTFGPSADDMEAMQQAMQS